MQVDALQRDYVLEPHLGACPCPEMHRRLTWRLHSPVDFQCRCKYDVDRARLACMQTTGPWAASAAPWSSSSMSRCAAKVLPAHLLSAEKQHHLY